MDKRVWTGFAKDLYGKVFPGRGYIKQALFENLFDKGILLMNGLRAKRCIIECINYKLKTKANIVHSRHRSLYKHEHLLCPHGILFL